MGTNFAKLMGQIKQLEINISYVEKQLEGNFTTYDETIKQLILNLDNSSLLVKTINQKNITEIKDIFKKILQISKKELDMPLKAIKKSCDQLEKHLNKVAGQIKSYNAKADQESKIIISFEENNILTENINELFAQLENQKNKLNYLFDNLFVVQEKSNHIKQAIEQYDAIKEETKITKQINFLINKSQATEYLVNDNTHGLLEQLETLVNMIKSHAITEPHLITETQLPLEIEVEAQTGIGMENQVVLENETSVGIETEAHTGIEVEPQKEHKSLLNQFDLQLAIKEQSDFIEHQKTTTEATIATEILTSSSDLTSSAIVSPRISV